MNRWLINVLRQRLGRSRRFVLPLVAIAMGSNLFVACGNNSANSNLSMPVVDTTKVTPPAIAVSPTKSPTAIAGTSTSTTNLSKLAIGALETYKHPSGILEINVPKGWQIDDKSQAGELLITWNEPAGRSTLSTNIFVPPSEIPEERLPDLFTAIVKGMYGNRDEFVVQSPIVESTGTIVIVWTASINVDGQKTKFIANSRFKRSNNKFSILTFGAIELSFNDLKDTFFGIANNQIVDGNVAIPENIKP
ncbi:hypothetical protein H6F44_15165 [Pseudanabaena sp. FACHB-1277]|uniref:Uncharacterized protein n=1 Tax=Pseudanabaena cinerea FACHB-1277 TaxID=2949581 RepID=A0A926UWR8_9CYAN|nr:hypothetical protein [Pseudanabaena cinerea]MBD2151450.1 hypothetical protein [Pseudanabaena cinerea FACHB-1277]